MATQARTGFQLGIIVRRAALVLVCAITIAAIVGCQTTDGKRRSCLFSQSCGNDLDSRGQSTDVSNAAPKPPASEPLASLDERRNRDGDIAAKAQTLASSAAPAANTANTANIASTAPAAQFVGETDAATSRAPAANEVANDFFTSNSTTPLAAPSAADRPLAAQVAPAPSATAQQEPADPRVNPQYRTYGPAIPQGSTFSNQNRTANSGSVGFASGAQDYSAQDYSAQLPAEIKAASSLFEFGEMLPDNAPTPAEFATPDAAPAQQTQPTNEMNPPVESPTVNAESAAFSAAQQLGAATLLSGVTPKTVYMSETSAQAYAQPQPAQSGTTYSAYPTQQQAPAAYAAQPTAQPIAQQPAAQQQPAATNGSNLRPSRFFPGQFIGGGVDGSQAQARPM